MREIDERAIKAHADQRFRSEYDYALFEYFRSAKVIAFLERAGVAVGGRVLDSLGDTFTGVISLAGLSQAADPERHVRSLLRRAAEIAVERYAGAAQ